MSGPRCVSAPVAGRPARRPCDRSSRRPRSRSRAPFRSLAALAILAVALLGARRAYASPAVEGTRNLALAGTGRASASGTSAVLLNPSAMSFAPLFTVEPMYQGAIQSRTHGLGIVAADSLNNARFSLALGYLFLRGTPRIGFFDTDLVADRNLELSLFGHEAFLAVSVTVIKNWLSLGLKPKYQYLSLRYRDANGVARDAHEKLNMFGLDPSLTINLAGWVAIAVTATNVVGNHPPAYRDGRDVKLTGLPVAENSIDHKRLDPLSPYPLGLAHGVSVFPLHNGNFSLNVDGVYDFTTYSFENYTRLVYGGSAEVVAGPVPIRFGTAWDSRGRGGDDDRIFVAGGLGYLKPARSGSIGVDIGVGFRQQVTGPLKETVLGLNIGIRIHPDL